MKEMIEDKVAKILGAEISTKEINQAATQLNFQGVEIVRLMKVVLLLAYELDEHQKERGSVKYLHGEPL
jgi:hypothetical protein